MSDVALLNPQQDAGLAKKIVEAARLRLHEREQVLLTSVLDPNTYHQNMGAIIVLREVIAEQDEIYRRAMNV